MLNPNSEMAARLKAEGNALFQAKDYGGAYGKYTQAISYDSSNAILYCNRSACSLGLRRRLDAADDAEKATELDPNYAKAWARLAAARTGSLSTQAQAIDDLKKAISVLPPESASMPAIQKQRADYMASVDAAEKQGDQMNRDAMVRAMPVLQLAGIPEDKMPWNLAAKLIPSLKSTGQWNSSAWLIRYARGQWQAGVDILRELKVMDGPGPGQTSALGQQGCLQYLSNSVLSDPRAWKVMRNDEGEKIALLPSQRRLELMTNGGWCSGGSRRVIAEATERMKAGNVDAVRESLSLTVRSWIVCGFIEDYVMGAIEHALDYYTNALEVLEWGMELWKDEDLQVPELIFQAAFVRAVKCLHLQILEKVYYKAGSGDNSEHVLEEIGAGAQALIDELSQERETPLGEWEYAPFLGFVRYQLAHAHALRGFYFHQSGKRALRAAEGLNEEVADLLVIAADAYLDAARVYPEDDEYHFWSLWHAYNILLDATHPVGELVDIMGRAQEAAKKMTAVWEVALHTAGSERDEALDSCNKWRADLLSNIEQGVLTRDAPIMRPTPPLSEL